MPLIVLAYPLHHLVMKMVTRWRWDA